MTDTQWVCLSINYNSLKDGDFYSLIKKEMNHIFHNDLKDMVVLCDKLSKDVFEMNVENYVFVKVSNYNSHIKELKDSQMIFGVLESYDNPSYIDEEEVFKFRDNMKIKSNLDELKNGDVVCVKEGYLKNLNGVVIDKMTKADKYKIMFKFHTSVKVESMYRKNLVYMYNILDIEYIRDKYVSFLRDSKQDEDILRRR